jgi:hypothetical protein
MHPNLVRFQVSKLAASVAEGVSIEWQGQEFNSGPLTIELDENGGRSVGIIDYARGRAEAEFHVRLAFPELVNVLESLGVEAELTRPVCAVLRSDGEILDDHSFVLSGRCELAPHEILSSAETTASVLPGK